MAITKDTLVACEANLKRDVLIRMKELKVHLEYLELKINRDDDVLNDLGEIQGVANILDCRIASLATVRMLLS